MTHETVYQTDSLGIFIGTAIADKSPLEPGVLLIPRGCVETAPPAIPEGKVAHWDGEKWSLITSYNGLTAYDTRTGEPLHIERHGQLPTGYTLEVPAPGQVWKNGDWVDDVPKVLAALHREQTDAINRDCEAAIMAGFWSDALGSPHFYTTQWDDQLNLLGAAMRGLEIPYPCRDEQGAKVFRPHTPEQLRKASDHLTLHKLTLLQHANTLKQQLDEALAALDLPRMKAIHWERPAQ